VEPGSTSKEPSVSDGLQIEGDQACWTISLMFAEPNIE
jgi:hypothetical protein